MKRFILLFVFSLLLILPAVAVAQSSPFKGCKPEGRGKKTKKNPTGKLSAKTQAQNVLKNRDNGPEQIDTSVTLTELLRKSNNGTFQPSQGVEITGYVVDVSPGGVQESCNCSRKTLQDIHIDVVLNQADATDKTKHFIVEITPKFKKQLGSFKKVRAAIKEKWVTFTGWLFYDSIHQDEAENTAPGRVGNWRATAWEVHPVSKLKVIPAP